MIQIVNISFAGKKNSPALTWQAVLISHSGKHTENPLSSVSLQRTEREDSKWSELIELPELAREAFGDAQRGGKDCNCLQSSPMNSVTGKSLAKQPALTRQAPAKAGFRITTRHYHSAALQTRPCNWGQLQRIFAGWQKPGKGKLRILPLNSAICRFSSMKPCAMQCHWKMQLSQEDFSFDFWGQKDSQSDLTFFDHHG